MDLTLWHYQFRIIMLGDSTVGKSSMLKRYTENQFLECINETVGVDFYVHFLEVEPGMMIKLQFWDTAGQERFRYSRLTSNVFTFVLDTFDLTILAILFALCELFPFLFPRVTWAVLAQTLLEC